MTFLEIALVCIARGWFVFPCIAKTKQPAIKGGFLSATNDASKVREWWTRWPDANVAIATGASGITVLDCDHGNANEVEARAWIVRVGLPATFTVRTGRRWDPKDPERNPEFGVQMYFLGGGLKSIAWRDGVHSGDVRSATGYVLAAGSIHPDSGERYEVIIDAPLAEVPEYVRTVPPAPISGQTGGTNEAFQNDGGPITESRNVKMISLLGKYRSAGNDDDALREYAIEVNETRIQPPLVEEELERLIANASRFPLPEPEPEILIGGRLAGTEPPPALAVDWRTRYMTEDAYLNIKPPEFLIDRFLVKKSIAMLAGPVAQRKSIIALNIAHALCTGEPLFGYFNISGGHERVVYLCPEMGAASFVKRIKQIGLGGFVGKTLFVQTMSEKPTALDDLDGELPGAVVIVDTITRFIEGNENDSEDMRKFAQKVFRLMSAGATVVLLHHSKKGSSGSLDDGLRGSSELAAFVDSCWVTDLEDPKKPYESLSKMRNVKQRDFESDPFKLKPSPGSYYLTIDGKPEPEAVLKGKADDAAHEALRKLLAVNPKIGINKICSGLRASGYGRGPNWVRAARATLLGTGVTIRAAHAPCTVSLEKE